jgi:transposase
METNDSFLDPFEEIRRLSKIIDEQNRVIAELKARLGHFETPKNSRNSSFPPSRDINKPKRTKSLRIPSGKKPGGQPGHEGTTLDMVENPDEVIEHNPQYCTCCGCDISNVPAEFVESRQEIVLPEIKPLVIEHQFYKRKCTCGHEIIGEFPAGVTPGVSYGNSVENIAAYMSARQFVPYRRLAEIFRHIFNLPISEGALVNSVNRVAKKAIPGYNLIHQRAEFSKVNGGDETGMKINGKKGWFWTIQGKLFTYIIASLNRGAQTLYDHFPNGFVFSVLVHDCWKCYFKVPSLAHQICLVHILRELNHICDCYKLKWASDFKQLLTESIEFKKTLHPEDYHKTISQRTFFEERLDSLLQTPISSDFPIAASLQERLVKHRQHIFTFLYYNQVPPDNNGSEQAIRNVKVKQKISGQFKSFEGAESFAILRSIIDTAIKNGLNPLHTISQLNALSL